MFALRANCSPGGPRKGPHMVHTGQHNPRTHLVAMEYEQTQWDVKKSDNYQTHSSLYVYTVVGCKAEQAFPKLSCSH